MRKAYGMLEGKARGKVAARSENVYMCHIVIKANNEE